MTLHPCLSKLYRNNNEDKKKETPTPQRHMGHSFMALWTVCLLVHSRTMSVIRMFKQIQRKLLLLYLFTDFFLISDHVASHDTKLNKWLRMAVIGSGVLSQNSSRGTEGDRGSSRRDGGYPAELGSRRLQKRWLLSRFLRWSAETNVGTQDGWATWE
jgi:hypothetical protein